MQRFICSYAGFLLAGAVLLLACRPSQLFPADYVMLQTGTSLQVPEGITLKADSVSVSICPENFNCLIPNNASLTLNLSKGAQSTSVRLFSFIPNHVVRRPVYSANLTDSASVELGGQRYKVILKNGRNLEDGSSLFSRRGEVIVQVAKL